MASSVSTKQVQEARDACVNKDINPNPDWMKCALCSNVFCNCFIKLYLTKCFNINIENYGRYIYICQNCCKNKYKK